MPRSSFFFSLRRASLNEYQERKKYDRPNTKILIVLLNSIAIERKRAYLYLCSLWIVQSRVRVKRENEREISGTFAFYIVIKTNKFSVVSIYNELFRSWENTFQFGGKIFANAVVDIGRLDCSRSGLSCFTTLADAKERRAFVSCPGHASHLQYRWRSIRDP